MSFKSKVFCFSGNTLQYGYSMLVKGIVHFEIDFWYVLAYLKGIQDVGVFVSTVFSILIILGQTVLVCQSYTYLEVYGVHLNEKSILNII